MTKLINSIEVSQRQYDGKFVLWRLVPNPTMYREDFDHYWKNSKNKYGLLMWVPDGVFSIKKEAYEKGLTFNDKEAKV